MEAFDRRLILAAGLIILSAAASKASSRFGIPALLLFLAIGMAVGTQGIQGIPLISYSAAQELGVFALIFILYSGGLGTDLTNVRRVFAPALVLSTAGVVVATALVGLFSSRLLGFSAVEGCLLGAAVASTDVAAVFTVLRSKSVSLRRDLGPLLELESALNDPMTVFLGVGLLGLIGAPDRSPLGLVPAFLQQMVFGAAFGWAFGRGAVWVINRINLEFEGLYPVLSLGLALLTYAATQWAHGSGFLAVYAAGITLGNANLLHRKTLIHFHEGVAWLMQIAMFLALGLLANPHELLSVAPYGLALSVFVLLVARPVSVFACLPAGRFNAREKLMISWAGLRGAVPIILATYPLVAGIPKARGIFDLVFFVTFASVLLQGATIPWVARLLKVDLPFKEKFRFPIEFNPTPDLKSRLLEAVVPPGASSAGKSLVALGLPKDVLVVLIQREGSVLIPRGGTQLKEGDTLLVLAENKTAGEVERLL